MSVQNSYDLQRAMYDRLSTDPAIVAAIGGHVYDALPAGQLPDLFISLGVESFVDRSDKTGSASQHDTTVAVIASQPGFLAAKELAADVAFALGEDPLQLAHDQTSTLEFLRAEARRDTDSQTRRIDMVFRVRIYNA